MNRERSLEIEFLRGELVGPARALEASRPASTATFNAERAFQLPAEAGGTLFWVPEGIEDLQEVVHYRGETPLQRYGAGLLHPGHDVRGLVNDEPVAATQSVGPPPSEVQVETTIGVVGDTEDQSFQEYETEGVSEEQIEQDDDFEVASADMYKPSVMGVSFCLEDEPGEIVIALPPTKKFFWQLSDATPFQVNGSYERCFKDLHSEGGVAQRVDAWRRVPATSTETFERFYLSNLKTGVTESRKVNLSCGLRLEIQLNPRRMHGKWVITCVLRNLQDAGTLKTLEERIRSVLFQAYFEVRTQYGAKFSRYPEGIRPFDLLVDDEQTLALLYRDA
jgi:hypothetical protein